MPHLWDETPDVLPRSEFNPLTNPALERNLGRWAEVYFGNPPGKREEAISKLLQEIRSETLESLKGRPIRQEDFSQSPKLQEVACSACQRKNPSGQKFCGQCGATLNSAQSAARNNSEVAAPQVAAAAPPTESENDVQWLRDRALSSLYGSPAPARRRWKYVVGGLMIALAGFAYLQWGPKLQTRAASPGTTAPRLTAPETPLPVENSSPAAAQRPVETISPASKPSKVQPRFATADANDRKTAPQEIRPAVQKSSLLVAATSPQAAGGGDSGAPDLRLAQRYLGGSMGVRDSSEAAKLLWKAVRKENTTAAVLLSDLYLRGDGVPKSCDQARLLLVAAAKRRAPQAAEHLRSLESRGCR